MVQVHFLLTIALVSQLQTGSLTVNAPPGSEVLWEGVPLGTVPGDGVLRISEILPGDYRIVVRKPGFSPEEKSVTVVPADQTVAFRLESVTPDEGGDALALEERSSQIQDTLQTPLFWSILVACALFAALFRFLWSQRRASGPPQPVWENAGEPFPPPGESPSNSWPAAPAFLDDLKRREELAEQGAADSVRKAGEEPIELGEDDVRSVDE